MEYQSLLHKKLHAGAFVFTAETTPPDASNKGILLENGELDLREWQVVREAALGKAHEQQAAAAGAPPDHLLSQPEHSGLPFIVSSAEQAHLSTGFRRGALAYAAGFLLAGMLATWLMTSRLIG